MDKQKKEITFEKQILNSGLFPNIGAAIVLVMYVFFFAGINARQFLDAGIVALLVLFSMQFLLGPFTNANSTRKVSTLIKEWKETGLNMEERTELLERILYCPKHVGKSVFAVFGAGTVIWALFFYFYIKVDLVTEIFILMSCMFAAYIASILGLYFAETVCSNYAVDLIEEGVDEELVQKNRYFGTSLLSYFILFVIIPLVFTNLVTFLFAWKGNHSSVSPSLLIPGTAVIIAFNAVITIVLSSSLGLRVYKSMKEIQTALSSLHDKQVVKSQLIPTDLSNELSYSMFMINETIRLFKTMIDKTKEIGRMILDATQDLVVVSNQNSSTSVEQAAGVREIVSAMEDSDQLTKNIAFKVSEVNDAAGKTAQDVQEGKETLTINLQKMQEITEANIKTTTGIKSLSEQIESIWDIVNIINNIADQTKIIAFNAELEAASAGEAGKNFHIVANEIRRLADGTMESTKEIKERINEIQHSSDKLIVTSEGGTGKIQEGCELSSKLENSFGNIKESSEITADTAGEIKMIIEQQTAAFDQILVTLKQISAGIENFSSSTQSVNDSSLQLQHIADKLADITQE